MNILFNQKTTFFLNMHIFAKIIASLNSIRLLVLKYVGVNNGPTYISHIITQTEAMSPSFRAVAKQFLEISLNAVPQSRVTACEKLHGIVSERRFHPLA